jgi:hypothetical protein
MCTVHAISASKLNFTSEDLLQNFLYVNKDRFLMTVQVWIWPSNITWNNPTWAFFEQCSINVFFDNIIIYEEHGGSKAELLKVTESEYFDDCLQKSQYSFRSWANSVFIKVSPSCSFLVPEAAYTLPFRLFYHFTGCPNHVQSSFPNYAFIPKGYHYKGPYSGLKTWTPKHPYSIFSPIIKGWNPFMGMTCLSVCRSVALSSCTDFFNALRFWNTVFSNRRKGS